MVALSLSLMVQAELAAEAFAQSSSESPAAEDAGPTPSSERVAPPPVVPTSSVAEAPSELSDEERPDDGPGSLISAAESKPPRPPTALEVESADGFEQELARLRAEVDYYREGIVSFFDDQRQMVRLKYQEQKDQLDLQYENRIAELEVEERKRRAEAIARFEAFLKKYPDNEKYTPDAMFRLAELYFERSSDDFLRESRAYEDELLAWENGERSSEPPSPEPRFDQTIGLHQELLERFPNYRLADAAQYLLGYAYGEMARDEEALLAYQNLVDSHPNSKFVPEVWTRIGEIHFDGDSRESLDQAIAAYGEVLSFPKSPYYDKALYKIAWTYYRLDQFDDSVDAFIRLVRYADRQEAETGVSGSELRSEALQYIAISLADESWGGFDTARSKLAAVDREPFAQEIWKRYGEVLFEQSRYEDAVKVLAHSVRKYPDAASNPEAQAQIVQAYEQLRDFDSATKAREVLVEKFGEGSVWAQRNADDPEALARAESLTERSLYTAALFRHQQAQSLRAQGETEESRIQYQAAASAYRDYLARFPDSASSYDFNFYLAETLYYSDNFEQAAARYASVRDSAVNNKHLEPAALFSVISLEKRIEQLEKSGRISPKTVQTAVERGERPVTPEALPPARVALVEASDRYVELVPNSENVPAIAYRAAEEFYKHDQFDEARRRFERIVATHPEEKVAQFSANLIIESYLVAEEWDKVDEWSGRLIEVAQRGSSGGPRGGALVDDLQDVRLKAQFKIAESHNEKGDFEEAAKAYVSLVDANPRSEVADKALFNAAVAYEKAKRFDTASRVYRRIYDNYPQSELAPRSIFRVGVNAEKGFDFESAIGAYNSVVEKYPDSEDRADALYNLAVVLENTQRYRDAANAYRRYAATFEERPDAGEVFFRSALVYKKLEDWGMVSRTLEEFVRSYRRVPEQQGRIVRAYQEVGEAEVKRGRATAAQDAYASCVREFDRLGLAVSSRAGGYAAQCAFQLAEYKFEQYDAMTLAGNERQQVRALQKKAQAQQAVERAYADIFRYKRLEETLAASYRIGHSYERFAEALFAAPVPREFQRDPELADEYKAQLEDQAAVLERKAEQAYRKAHDEARRSGVTNEWTQKILEGLNKFAPNEFPIQKSGKAALQTEIISGHGLDLLGAADGSKPTGLVAPGSASARRGAVSRGVRAGPGKP